MEPDFNNHQDQEPYNLSEIYSRLGDCPSHHKPLEFVCTSPSCLKPRLACNKCLFDQSHGCCLNRMVLLDDVLTPSCFSAPKDSLRNWIPTEDYCRQLSAIQRSLYDKNIDIALQEAGCMVEEKWQQIESEAKARLGEILEAMHARLMETFKQSSSTVRLYRGFESHFNPDRLAQIMQKDGVKEINAALAEFFNVSAEELLGVQEKKDNPGQQDHYIWLMAKLKEKLRLQMKQLQKELEEETDMFIKGLELKAVKKLDLVEISRFEGYKEGMLYGNQRCDCVTFSLSEKAVLYGLTIYKSTVQDANWNVLVQVIEGEKASGPVLKKQLFRVKNTPENIQDPTATLLFGAPTEIPEDKKYTAYVLINGPQTLKGIGGKLTVKHQNLIVRFFDTVHSEKDPKNVTGTTTGQIPALFFAIKG